MDKSPMKVKLKRTIQNNFVRFAQGCEGEVEEIENGRYEFSAIPQTVFWVLCKKEDFETVN